MIALFPALKDVNVSGASREPPGCPEANFTGHGWEGRLRRRQEAESLSSVIALFPALKDVNVSGASREPPYLPDTSGSLGSGHEKYKARPLVEPWHVPKTKLYELPQ